VQIQFIFFIFEKYILQDESYPCIGSKPNFLIILYVDFCN